MQYTETQLNQLIADVEREFTAHLAKSEELAPVSTEEVLVKAEDVKKPEEKKDKEEPKEKPEEEHESHETPKEEAKEHEEKPAEEAHEEAQPQEAPAHDYDDEDMQHLEKMYMSMSDGELKVHHDMIAKCGMAKCGEVEATGEPMGSPGPKAPATEPQPAVQKSEDGLIERQDPKGSPGPKSEASAFDADKLTKWKKSEHTRQSGGEITKDPEPKCSPGPKSEASKVEGQMEKSENTNEELLKAELSESKQKLETLQKNFDAVAAFLTKLVEKKVAPAAKAITSLDVIAKSEDTQEKTLTKTEIHNVLCKKSADPSLQKSDREAINVYYAEGQVDIKGISHLLK